MSDLLHTGRKLQLLIRSRERLIFQGEAKAVTSVNEGGPFDILPQHTNFITSVKDYIEVHKMDDTSQKIPIADAILKASNNTVKIYLGVVTKPQTPPARPVIRLPQMTRKI